MTDHDRYDSHIQISPRVPSPTDPSCPQAPTLTLRFLGAQVSFLASLPQSEVRFTTILSSSILLPGSENNLGR